MSGALQADNNGGERHHEVEVLRLQRRLEHSRTRKSMPGTVRFDSTEVIVHRPSYIPGMAPGQDPASVFYRQRRAWRRRYLFYLAWVVAVIVLLIVAVRQGFDSGAGDGPLAVALWGAFALVPVAFTLEATRAICLWPAKRRWLDTLTPEERALWMLGRVAMAAAVVYAGHRVNDHMRQWSQPRHQ